MLRMIHHIYQDRRFRVIDAAAKSSQRPQRSGISQGCPLSPFPVVVLITIMIRDSLDMLSPEVQAAYEKGLLDVLLYADDT